MPPGRPERLVEVVARVVAEERVVGRLVRDDHRVVDAAVAVELHLQDVADLEVLDVARGRPAAARAHEPLEVLGARPGVARADARIPALRARRTTRRRCPCGRRTSRPSSSSRPPPCTARRSSCSRCRNADTTSWSSSPTCARTSRRRRRNSASACAVRSRPRQPPERARGALRVALQLLEHVVIGDRPRAGGRGRPRPEARAATGGRGDRGRGTRCPRQHAPDAAIAGGPLEGEDALSRGRAARRDAVGRRRLTRVRRRPARLFPFAPDDGSVPVRRARGQVRAPRRRRGT